MRIAYLISEDLSKHPGLKYKILGQIQRWQEHGHEVYQIMLVDRLVIAPTGNITSNKNNNFSILQGFTNKRLLDNILLIKEMSFKYKFAIEALKNIKPDLTYSRYLFPAPHIIDIHKYAGKLVFEINSDDQAEYMQKSKATGVYNYLFRRFTLQNADALVFVTKELSMAKSFKSFSKERTVIANGIDATDFNFLQKTNTSKPNLVFIGSPDQSWHGLDKIRLLAGKFEGYVFHIIGPSKEICQDKWENMPKNIIFHGYLSADDAKEVIKGMDIGIGTLALHRKAMHEACPLKVRQYLSQGLPILAASKDTDILEKKPFYFELPNSENNIESNYDSISDFVKFAYRNKKLRTQARDFSISFLSFDKKESMRLEFFDEVIGT